MELLFFYLKRKRKRKREKEMVIMEKDFYIENAFKFFVDPNYFGFTNIKSVDPLVKDESLLCSTTSQDSLISQNKVLDLKGCIRCFCENSIDKLKEKFINKSLKQLLKYQPDPTFNFLVKVDSKNCLSVPLDEHILQNCKLIEQNAENSFELYWKKNEKFLKLYCKEDEKSKIYSIVNSNLLTISIAREIIDILNDIYDKNSFCENKATQKELEEFYLSKIQKYFSNITTIEEYFERMIIWNTIFTYCYIPVSTFIKEV
jgi:hypothetical protein